MERVTGPDLQEYIDRFSQGFKYTLRPLVKAAVLKQVMDSEFLRSAFSTDEGLALFNHGLEKMTVELEHIIEKAVAGATPKTAEKIVPHAQTIKIVYEMMVSWAETYKSGQKHLNNIKEK